MSEKKIILPSSQSEQAPTTEPASDDGMFGIPQDVWVRGGTTSGAHDRAEAQAHFEAEQRRDEYDKAMREEQLMAKAGGREYVHQMTSSPEVPVAWVILEYLTRQGQPDPEGHVAKCEVLQPVNPQFPDELAVLVPCIVCKKRGRKMDQCTMQVRQSNRRFQLDQRKAGTMVPWEDPFHGLQMVRIAGEITSEKFRCDQCSTAYIIDKNRVWPQ